MLDNLTRNRLVGYWFAAVAVIFASATVMGINPDLSTAALLLTFSLVPPGIILMLWHGAPPATAAEVLYATNTRTNGRS
jgi:hypothetical protein